jgi:radical SAM superfamily enzyme YgiQ (UPF0313 family)
MSGEKRVLLLNPGKKNSSFEVGRIHMGLTLMSSLLTRAGHDVRLVDFAFLQSRPRSIPIPSVEETLRDFVPDVVGISVFSYLFDECKELVNRVAACARPTIILGGPHFTIFPKDFALDRRIGFIVRGEAESVIEGLLNMKRPEDGPVLVEAPPAKAEQIPPIDLGSALGGDLLEEYQIQLSRGCPYNCSFCNVSQLAGRRIRPRDLDVCMREIVEARYKFPRLRLVTITDDCPTYDKERFKTFLRLFAKAGTGCSLTVDNMRADAIDDEMLALYKAAGGVNICLGVESRDPLVFGKLSKGESLERIEEAAKLVRKHGLSLGMCFVIGLPDDNGERHLRSVRFAKRARPDYVFWNMCVPWPGTQVHRWYLEHGTVGDPRNFSTLIDPHLNFSDPTCESAAFPKHMMVRAWLMANMETHDYFSLRDLPKMLRLVIRYRLFRSFFYFLFRRLPNAFYRGFMPDSLKAPLRKRFANAVARIKTLSR